MRIVIDTSQPDEGQDPSQVAVAQMAGTQGAGAALDGGPAPVALLRQFGRIPEAVAETTEVEAREGGVAEGGVAEGGEVPLNPLRQGAAAAMERQRSGGQAPTQAAGAAEAPADDRAP